MEGRGGGAKSWDAGDQGKLQERVLHFMASSVVQDVIFASVRSSLNAKLLQCCKIVHIGDFP